MHACKSAIEIRTGMHSVSEKIEIFTYVDKGGETGVGLEMDGCECEPSVEGTGGWLDVYAYV
jgi:hypothetical protein